MRTIVRLVGVAGALLVAACSGQDQLVDEAFQKDLELASASSPITLQSTQPAAQVVSAIERTAPAPKRIARSQRVVKYTPRPRATPAPVEVEEADASVEAEPTPVEIAEAPVEIEPLPSPRPQPVASTGGGRDDGRIGMGTGEAIGAVIGVVLRGGHGGIDHCDPRTDGRQGRRGGTIAINNRIPVVGTFPGAGRIQGTFPGRIVGRSRF